MIKQFIWGLTAVFVSLAYVVPVQASEQEAFQAFKQARQAYEEQKFVDAVNLLDKTKSLLGSTNMRIQPMLVKSLANSGYWDRAKVEIGHYYDLNPPKDLIEYQEIVDLELVVDKKIAAEARRVEAERQAAVARMQAEKRAAERDLASAKMGNTQAMSRLIARYRSGDGVEKNTEEAQFWEAKLTEKKERLAAEEAERQRIRHAESIARQIDNVSYFPETSSMLRMIFRSLGRDPFLGSTGVVFSPLYAAISLATDLAKSEPTNATNELRELREQAVLRPSAWGNPQSLIARVSKPNVQE